jgi:hypothetical protein
VDHHKDSSFRQDPQLIGRRPVRQLTRGIAAGMDQSLCKRNRSAFCNATQRGTMLR